MPTNRMRRARNWSAGLDQFRREMLIDGPEMMLLAGVGFMEGRRAAVFDAADPDEQAAVLLDMRLAWQQHGAKLIVDHRAMHGPTAPIWAEAAFGDGRRIPAALAASPTTVGSIQ